MLKLDLDGLVREGARRMLLAALRAEVDDYVAQHADHRDDAGHALVAYKLLAAAQARWRCVNAPLESHSFALARPSWTGSLSSAKTNGPPRDQHWPIHNS